MVYVEIGAFIESVISGAWCRVRKVVMDVDEAATTLLSSHLLLVVCMPALTASVNVLHPEMAAWRS